MSKVPDDDEPSPRPPNSPDPIDRFGYVEGGALRVVRRSDPPGELIDFSSVVNKRRRPPLTLKFIDDFTPQDFVATRVWAGCYDRNDDLRDMAEDGYSAAEIAAATLPFGWSWPDEDHYFPIAEDGIDRQHRTRGLLLSATIHCPGGQALPGFSYDTDDYAYPYAFFGGRTYCLEEDYTWRDRLGLRDFYRVIALDSQRPLVIETLLTGRLWTVGLR